jgi:hypothetical protein
VTNGKKRKKTIFRLKTKDEEIEGDKDLLYHATSSDKSLFGHSKNCDLEVDDLLWREEEKVSREDNESLSRRFELEEIR